MNAEGLPGSRSRLSRFVLTVAAIACGGLLVRAAAGFVEDTLRIRVESVVEQEVIDLDFFEGSGLDSIALADVDLDGNLDLLTVDNDAESFTVRLGAGDGSVGAPASFPAQDVDGVSFFPVLLVVDDFTSPFDTGAGRPDGNPDVAVLGETGELYISIGNGDGTFAPPDQEVDSSAEVFFPLAAKVGHFDGNDDADIVVVEEDVLVPFCNQGGAFELCPGGVIDLFDIAEDPLAVDGVVGDFDGDGNDDVAALSPAESVVYPYFSDGEGAFAIDLPILIPESMGGGAIAVGRMNSDEIDDLVVVLQSQFGDNATVALGTPGRVFQLLPFAAPETSTALAVGLFDADDLDDMLFSAASNLFFIAGNGTGDYSADLGAIPATELGMLNRRMSRAYTLKTGDLDNDLFVDVVGLVAAGSEIEIGINVTDEPSPTPTEAATATPSPTEAASPSATATAIDSPTAVPTPTERATQTPRATATRPRAIEDDSCAIAPPRRDGAAGGWLIAVAVLAFARRRRGARRAC